MSCTKYEETASLYCDGALEAPQREEFERHLAVCADCRKLVDFYKEIGDCAARDLVEPPAGLLEKTVAAAKENRAPAAVARRRMRMPFTIAAAVVATCMALGFGYGGLGELFAGRVADEGMVNQAVLDGGAALESAMFSAVAEEKDFSDGAAEVSPAAENNPAFSAAEGDAQREKCANESSADSAGSQNGFAETDAGAVAAESGTDSSIDAGEDGLIAGANGLTDGAADSPAAAVEGDSPADGENGDAYAGENGLFSDDLSAEGADRQSGAAEITFAGGSALPLSEAVSELEKQYGAFAFVVEISLSEAEIEQYALAADEIPTGAGPRLFAVETGRAAELEAILQGASGQGEYFLLIAA